MMLEDDDNLDAIPATGAPRWMVTFADMMSLLFAMFVLLLSFANFDEVKFSVNAKSMRDAFQVTEREPTITNLQASNIRSLEKQEQKVSALRNEVISQQLIDQLHDDIVNEIVVVEKKDNGVLIRFPNSAAFGSGAAELSGAAFDALDKVIQILNPGKEKILISGYTDDIPISNELFRSNWDLASARAVSVAHYLLDNKVVKNRITVQSLADTHPLVPNDTTENRALNRRVEIYIEFTEKE